MFWDVERYVTQYIGPNTRYDWVIADWHPPSEKDLERIEAKLERRRVRDKERWQKRKRENAEG